MAATETIPLFPLDTVLFPGMALPLHIFEPRYRRMVRDCLARSETFGMIWAEEEPVTLRPDQLLVGTKTTLVEVAPLADGRYNLHTVGSERFIVRTLFYDRPYLVGEVEPYPATGGTSAEARAHMAPLSELFERYLSLLGELTEQEISLQNSPTSPETLAFAVAILYQGQNWRKQALLAEPTIPDLMRREIEWLRIENVLVQQALRYRQRGAIPPLLSGPMTSYGLN